VNSMASANGFVVLGAGLLASSVQSGSLRLATKSTSNSEPGFHGRYE